MGIDSCSLNSSGRLIELDDDTGGVATDDVVTDGRDTEADGVTTSGLSTGRDVDLLIFLLVSTSTSE